MGSRIARFLRSSWRSLTNLQLRTLHSLISILIPSSILKALFVFLLFFPTLRMFWRMRSFHVLSGAHSYLIQTSFLCWARKRWAQHSSRLSPKCSYQTWNDRKPRLDDCSASFNSHLRGAIDFDEFGCGASYNSHFYSIETWREFVAAEGKQRN